jgi:RNase adaptor protein for sRNA GlmZ degradation
MMEHPIEEIDALQIEKAELSLQLAQANVQTAMANRDVLLKSFLTKYGIDTEHDRVDIAGRKILRPDISPKEVSHGA